jgi:hypothetical protein
MRLVLMTTMLAVLGAALSGIAGTPAQAQKYRVACVAPGAPKCRTACGSNTHTVVCFAKVQNGRCLKYCGRPR